MDIDAAARLVSNRSILVYCRITFVRSGPCWSNQDIELFSFFLVFDVIFWETFMQKPKLFC